jgi:hypothetical protein
VRLKGIRRTDLRACGVSARLPHLYLVAFVFSGLELLRQHAVNSRA